MLLAVLLFVSASTTTLAVDSGSIQPNYVGVSSVSPVVSMKTNTIALCSDKVTCKPGYTANVVWSFQYQNNKAWVSVQSWRNSGGTILLNQTAAVVSGRTYRLQVVATVYNSSGKQVETVTGVSNSIRT